MYREIATLSIVAFFSDGLQGRSPDEVQLPVEEENFRVDCKTERMPKKRLLRTIKQLMQKVVNYVAERRKYSHEKRVA